MPMGVQWFTLKYLSGPSKGPITLYNLQQGGVDRIKRVQAEMGSTNFEVVEQPHHYVQFEIDLMKGKS
jgi:hypothetical protein